MDTTHGIIYILDLIGTSAFAFSGALRAMDRRPDFIGMLILGGVTAIGGGMIRDALLGNRAGVLVDANYMYVILASILVLYWFPSSFWKRNNLFNYFDAFGFGVFSGVAANIGVHDPELHFLSVVILAVLTGCGGGVIRDVIIQKPSLPLSDELYVTPVILGALSLVLVHHCGWGGPWNELCGFLSAFFITTGLRLVAIYYDMRLPRVLFNFPTRE
ncbi:MAG: trimeric intracellular cation channel family protein [Planctomycetia bacterium]|nr:trimeric intracellular cation channel family protein [Planctomycetia bacterium]